MERVQLYTIFFLLSIIGQSLDASTWCLNSCNQENCSNKLVFNVANSCDHKYLEGKKALQRVTATDVILECTNKCSKVPCPDCTNKGVGIEEEQCKAVQHGVPFFNRFSQWEEVTPTDVMKGYDTVDCKCVDYNILTKEIKPPEINAAKKEAQKKVLANYAKIWKQKLTAQISFETRYLKTQDQQEKYGCFTTDLFKKSLENFLQNNPNCKGKEERLQEVMGEVFPENDIKKFDDVFPALDQHAKTLFSDNHLPNSCLSENDFIDMNENPNLADLSPIYSDFLNNPKISALVEKSTGYDASATDLYKEFMEYSKTNNIGYSPALLYVNQFSYALTDVLKFVKTKNKSGKPAILSDFMIGYNKKSDKLGYQKNLLKVHKDFCLYIARDLSTLVCTNEKPSILDYRTLNESNTSFQKSKELLLDKAYCDEKRFFESTSPTITKVEDDSAAQYNQTGKGACALLRGSDRELAIKSIMDQAGDGQVSVRVALDDAMAKKTNVCLRDQQTLLEKLSYEVMLNSGNQKVLSEINTLRNGVNSETKKLVVDVLDTRFHEYAKQAGSEESIRSFRQEGMTSFSNFNYSNLLYSKFNEFKHYKPPFSKDNATCFSLLSDSICTPMKKFEENNKSLAAFNLQTCINAISVTVIDAVRTQAYKGKVNTVSNGNVCSLGNENMTALIQDAVGKSLENRDEKQCKLPQGGDIYSQVAEDVSSRFDNKSPYSYSSSAGVSQGTRGNVEDIKVEGKASLRPMFTPAVSTPAPKEESWINPYPPIIENKVNDIRKKINEILSPKEEISRSDFQKMLDRNGYQLPKDEELEKISRAKFLDDDSLAEIQKLRNELASMKEELRAKKVVSSEEQNPSNRSSSVVLPSAGGAQVASSFPNATPTPASTSALMGGADGGGGRDQSIKLYSKDEQGALGLLMDRKGDRFMEIGSDKFGQIENNNSWLLKNFFNIGKPLLSECKKQENSSVIVNVVSGKDILTYKMTLGSGCQVSKELVAQNGKKEKSQEVISKSSQARDVARYNDLLKILKIR